MDKIKEQIRNTAQDLIFEIDKNGGIGGDVADNIQTFLDELANLQVD
jgi:hypothetical protein